MLVNINEKTRDQEKLTVQKIQSKQEHPSKGKGMKTKQKQRYQNKGIETRAWKQEPQNIGIQTKVSKHNFIGFKLKLPAIYLRKGFLTEICPCRIDHSRNCRTAVPMR